MAPDLQERSPEALLRSASRSLGDLLERDETVRGLVASDEPLPDYRYVLADALSREGLDGLRLERRRRLAQIAARDLIGEADLETVGRALADLADASIAAVLGDAVRLAVVAMGKLGGRELNYASDIDLMFVADGDLEAASKDAERILSALGEFSVQGQAYRIDLNLRPEGRSGAIVRSLDGYLEYYKRWAQPWEYQALLKARAVAGSNVGADLVESTRSLVFQPEISAERVAEIRKMKARVEEHASKSRRSRASGADDVKLGAGGIRDIEFTVQLLQLVHGGSDGSVRSGNTLEALDALVEGGYVAEDDGAGLSVAYRWLRNIEHRLQLWQERQVHHLPADEEVRSRIARLMGFRDSPSDSALARFEEVHRGVIADVRSRFERVFYRPMIESLASGTGLSPAALKDRLRVLGFRDIDRAARTLEGLVSGTSRRAKLFRVLTPAFLRFLTATPLPDLGLFSFLRLGEVLESRPDVLAQLRENPPGLEFLAKSLGSGRVVGETLLHVPEEVSVIADPRGPQAPKGRDQLVREAIASLSWREPERRIDGLRRFKRREMLRIVLRDIAGEGEAGEVGPALSDLAEATLEAALAEVDVPLAIVGMGKLGGRELNYSSDIDVMFVHEDDPHAAEDAAERLMRAVGEVTPEGQAFRIDANLRPEGRSGPLARSLQSYTEYYQRWARPWEHLALVKARSSAGAIELSEKLVESTRPLAYPESVDAEALAEIRHLKARMERERVPRGVDARRHIKMGPGGAADVEFAVQVQQFRHAHAEPRLQVTGTVEGLRALASAGIVDEDDARFLEEAYVFLARIRNHLFLMHERPIDVLPNKPEELEALGMALGFEDQPRQELDEAFLKHTRRARRVAEPLIYG